MHHRAVIRRVDIQRDRPGRRAGVVRIGHLRSDGRVLGVIGGGVEPEVLEGEVDRVGVAGDRPGPLCTRSEDHG